MIEPKLMSEPAMSGLTSLAIEIAHWYYADLASEQECMRCHSSVHCPSDLDPTPLCDLCAQAIADQVPNLLSHIAALIAARESDRLEAAQTIADSEACITALIVAYLRRCDYPILALCIAKGDWKK